MTAALADGMPPAIETDTAPQGPDEPLQCAAKDWCIKGFGHSGQHKMDPSKTKRATRDRTGESARYGAAGAGGSAAERRPGRAPAATKKLGAAALGMGYAKIGQRLELLGYDPETDQYAPHAPAGRVMQFQAPLAGAQLDRLLTRRVPIYGRVTQMQGSSLLEELAPLVMGPLIAILMAEMPAMREHLEPMFVSVMESSALEVLKMERETAKAMTATLEARTEAQELAQEMLDSMFGPADPAPAEPAPESRVS
jgi:hypothetical protein